MGDSELACWGSAYAHVTTPPGGGSWAHVSVAGDGHACALTADGALTCWGAGAGPQGGEYAIPGVFAQVATAGASACALRADGTLGCFGDAAAKDWAAGAPGPEERFLEVSAL